MKVLHVGLETTAARHGGLNRYLEALVAAERADGVDADAIVLGDPADRRPSLADGFVLAGRSGRSMPRVAIDVNRAVRRHGTPELADLHFAGTSSLTATLGALRKVPKVVHFQGPWAEESAYGGAGRLNVTAKRVVEQCVYRRADRFVVLSSSFGDVLQRSYGIAPWSIEVIAPGVDLDRFGPGDQLAARTTLGVPSGRVVVAVRRLVPRMGLDVLLSAWAMLSPTTDDLLVLVGDGPSAEELHETADSLGVWGTVRFCGDVDDEALVAWYRAADVSVVPSVAHEGFGLVVLESLACGTPVVTTDAGGLGEVSASLGLDAVVPAGDVELLAHAVGKALERRGDAAVSARARTVAAAHGWAAVAARHRALYEGVLAGEPVPRVVILDHTALLSGGELAIARAIGGVGASARIHSILGEDGPLRRRLEAAGSTVEVLALPASLRTVRRGAIARTGPRQLWRTVRYVTTITRRLRELRPDLVHANSLKAALYGGAASRLAGVPCVWHVRDRLEPPALPPTATRLAHLAARVLPTVVLANSASTLATVGVAGGSVLPSPLDPTIDPSAPRPPSNGELRCTIVGRLAPWKGQHLAIEAFADAFAGSTERLRVVGASMFGEDDYAASLPVLAAQLGIASRVEFCGFVDDVASVLFSTDVLIHASTDPEPFGQVVIEAMGAGCVVLVADTGGPAEVITHGVDGLHYTMGDRVALSSALRRVADDQPLRERLSTAARRAATVYEPAALAPLLLDAWARARAQTPRRWRRRTRRG